MEKKFQIMSLSNSKASTELMTQLKLLTFQCSHRSDVTLAVSCDNRRCILLVWVQSIPEVIVEKNWLILFSQGRRPPLKLRNGVDILGS